MVIKYNVSNVIKLDILLKNVGPNKHQRVGSVKYQYMNWLREIKQMMKITGPNQVREFQ